MPPSQVSINPGRHLAYETFRATLLDLFGRDSITERRFRDEWLARLRDQRQLTLSGWYDPPPDGISVYFGRDDSNAPFSFASLRPEAYWPSDRAMNWSCGLMYGYCSPVDWTNGLPADFGITLYFGRDPSVRNHFARVLSITRDIIQQVTPRTMARSLSRESETMFREARMRNNVASVTDTVPVDLGHSLPVVSAAKVGNGRQLTAEAKAIIQDGRLFISESADWPLANARQVTIEPSLISLTDPQLPQISPHYVIAVSEAGVSICDECDTLYAEFDLGP